mgnify:CR=1 FL=1
MEEPRLESLGQVLHRIKDGLSRSTSLPLTNTETPSLDIEPPCGTCRGFKFVGYAVPLGAPDFGKLRPCPVCVTHEREARDWFAGLEVTPGNESAIRYAKQMAQNPTGWLVLTGNVGTGRTSLAKAILSHWAGKERIPTTASQLLDSWRSHIRTDDFEATFRRDVDTPLAVLDDLGAEKVTDWTADRLTQYLDWRYVRRQPTVITTNCDRASLVERFQDKGQGFAGERIADRLFDVATGLVRVVSLTGLSWRSVANE